MDRNPDCPRDCPYAFREECNPLHCPPTQQVIKLSQDDRKQICRDIKNCLWDDGDKDDLIDKLLFMLTNEQLSTLVLGMRVGVGYTSQELEESE